MKILCIVGLVIVISFLFHRWGYKTPRIKKGKITRLIFANDKNIVTVVVIIAALATMYVISETTGFSPNSIAMYFISSSIGKNMLFTLIDAACFIGILFVISCIYLYFGYKGEEKKRIILTKRLKQINRI